MLWIWNLRSPPFISVNTIQSASLVSYAYAKLTYKEKDIKIKSPFPKKTMISYQLLKRADNLPYLTVYNTHFFCQKCFSKFNVRMIHRILCFMSSCLDSYMPIMLAVYSYLAIHERDVFSVTKAAQKNNPSTPNESWAYDLVTRTLS